MDSIKTALANAGITIPLNRRIWMWLKDHPGKTYKEVAIGVKCNANNASGQLTQMTQRAMVSVQVEPIRGSNRTVGRYSVVGTEFELLPLPKDKPVAPTAQPAKATAAMPDPLAFDPERFLAKLTLAELRAVHAFTRTLFGK